MYYNPILKMIDSVMEWMNKNRREIQDNNKIEPNLAGWPERVGHDKVLIILSGSDGCQKMFPP